MNLSVRRLRPRAATIGLGLLLLLLIVNLFLSAWNIRRLVDNEERVVATQEVLATLEAVLARVTEAETAERGFLITGDDGYMAPYERAISRTWETLARLDQLIAGEPALEEHARALKARVDTRLEELKQAIAASSAGGFDAARQAVSTNRGRQLMIEMRALVSEMRAHEERSLEKWAAESRRSARLSYISDGLSMTVGIGLVGLAFFLFRRELELRQRAADATLRLAAIVESSEDAIISKGLDGTIVSWNAGAEHLYGYAPEEAIGRSITMLCPPEFRSEIVKDLERIRKGLPLAHFERPRIRKDGRRIDVSLSVSPIRNAAGEVIGAAAIARDITERQLLQREVLEIASREQRRIGQDLHDGIGQELTGLAMLAQRLVGLLARKALPEVVAATKIVDGLEHTLGQVRALSKGLVPVEVDAEGLMVALAELAARTSEMNSITCAFACDPPVCMRDNQMATHVYRMTQEALTNAVKHGRATRIAVRLTAEGDQVILQITDNGKGFAYAHPETTGMGLRIMRYRAELIGAQLTIGPAEPRGTCVTCTLHHAIALRPATPAAVVL
jgi:PAS domain S-box-containing protein